MLKSIIIIVLVVAVLGGGLLALKRSGRAGMPSQDVLDRATKRARNLAASEDEDSHGT
jgi:hypothetical protein